MTDPGLVVFYGTLMHTEPPLAQQPVLDGHAGYLRPCRLAGELWDYGPWPGFVPADGVGVVIGELWELRSAVALQILDAWEEYDELDPARSRYLRCVVTTLDEPCADAWVYVWNQSLDGLRRIETGDWRTRPRMQGPGPPAEH